MGRVNFGHLTLADLAMYFPDHYAKVRAFRSVAIVRDPVDRFFSAVFQRLREFQGYAQSQITPEIVDEQAQLLIRKLDTAQGRLELEFVHFNRQSDYVFNGAERIVDRTFALDRLNDASAYIEGLTGVRIEADARENRTAALRVRALQPAVRVLRKPYGALIPLATRERIHAGLVRAGVYGDVRKQQHAKPGSYLDGFLRTHFARDFELFDAAMAA